MSAPEESTRTRKGERTKVHIRETALELFQQEGYEVATMRGIAEAAGLSVGSTYYYFPSKEHLVQAIYMRLVRDHAQATAELLAHERALQKRIAGTMHAKLDMIVPYKGFAAGLAKVGIDPDSPVNPFSTESAPARAEAIALWKTVVDGAKERIHRDLVGELPEMLWLCSEGIVLYWVYDHTEGSSRTRDLIDDSAELLARLVKMAGSPLIGPVRKLILRIVRDAAPWRSPPE